MSDDYFSQEQLRFMNDFRLQDNQLLVGTHPAMNAAGEMPKKDPPLKAEMNCLRSEIVDLHQCIDVLADRLDPMLTGAGSMAPTVQRDSYGNSPVVMQTHEMSCMLHYAHQRLRDLLERIEL